MGRRRAMIWATPAGTEPLALAGFVESASAAIAIPRLGTGNTPAASWESGWKAFCGIMRASTS